MTEGYIYLLVEREFIKTNENIYKIGKTKQEFGKMFNQYPNGSILFLHLNVKNVDAFEKTLIELFCLEFKRRLDIGNEYFEGDVDKMKKLIYDCDINNMINKISETNIIIKEKEEINKVETLNLKLEKLNLKLEKEKIKEEKIKKDKEKLDKKQHDQIEKEALQKLEKEKKLQKEKKTNLFNELRKKVANMVEENYFIKYSFSICKIIRLQNLNGLSRYIKQEIHSYDYSKIYREIENIYDCEVCDILNKMNFENLKKRIILKIYSTILNPNISRLRNLINEIRETYKINENVLKNAKLEKFNIAYTINYWEDMEYKYYDAKIYHEHYSEYIKDEIIYSEDDTITIEEEL